MFGQEKSKIIKKNKTLNEKHTKNFFKNKFKKNNIKSLHIF
jgi:hypothetical protein